MKNVAKNLNSISKVNQTPETAYILNELVKPDSYILQKKDVTSNRDTIYEYEIVEKIDHKEGICYMPKWGMVLGLLSCISIMIIFIAALTVVFAAKRSSLYGESCYQRSCMKNLNLKCLNDTCQCYTTEYYNKGCLTKKTYSEKCFKSYNSSICDITAGLLCDQGYCKCLETQYWNGSKCVLRYNYTKSCSGDQCLTNLILECISKSCSCNNNR
jgi:hypothetical protein